MTSPGRTVMAAESGAGDMPARNASQRYCAYLQSSSGFASPDGKTSDVVNSVLLVTAGNGVAGVECRPLHLIQKVAVAKSLLPHVEQ